MKLNLKSLISGSVALSVCVALSALSGCKEQFSDGGGLESQVVAAEAEVADLTEELEEFRAKMEQKAAAAADTDPVAIQAELDQVQAANASIKNAYQEFELKHPMPD
ncbi:MAG: Tfp pilus assembly protein PilP [Verrucomicrobiales bacterium]|jgi:Tfp pilus assembly protein PilP